MAGSKEVTVRVQTLDGVWETLGADRRRGVYPEGVVLEADGWGSSHASFNLRRDPTSFWPDIGAFTPVEVEVGSTLVWSGRISETPARVAQRVINCQAEGWQYHLDDDLYQRAYVHTKLGEWKDARGDLNTNLAFWTTGFQVTNEGGAILLALPSGATCPPFGAVSVYLDLQTADAKRVVIVYDSGGTANFDLKITGGNAHATDGAEQFFADAAPIAAAETQNGVTFITSHRFVEVRMQEAGGGARTGDSTTWVRIKALRVFADTAWESFGLSTLKASDVVSDAVSRGTVLLASDTSPITSTSFSIPEYAPTGPQTPRQAWTAVDSFHDWHKQIDVYKRPVYSARPARPIFEVGAWSAIDDDDASANSGEDIYNRAILTGQTPDGQPISTTRVAGHSGQLFRSTGLSTSWSGPGSGGTFNITAGAPNTGPYRKGVSYAVRVRAISHVQPGGGNIDLVLGDAFAGDTVSAGSYSPTYTGPGPFFIWTPTADRTNFGWTANFHTMPDDDSVRIDAEVWWGNTIPERRGFRRAITLPIQAALPNDDVAAGQIGDVWMGAHRTTPFKGSVTLTGDQSLRHVLTGHNVPLETLLLNTGQLLRFSDRSDPDTGGHGRDGRIAAVTYTPATDTAQVTIDNSRTSFDALVSRLAVIQGG